MFQFVSDAAGTPSSVTVLSLQDDYASYTDKLYAACATGDNPYQLAPLKSNFRYLHRLDPDTTKELFYETCEQALLYPDQPPVLPEFDPTRDSMTKLRQSAERLLVQSLYEKVVADHSQELVL